MKARLVIIALAAVVLAGFAVGAGYSAAQSYWSKNGSTYSCTGTSNIVQCKETGTGLLVLIGANRDIFLSYGKHPLFWCPNGNRYACKSFVG